MKLEITNNTIVCRANGLIASNIDGEIVMMSVEQGEYFGLDQIASRIWELIATPVRVDDLIKQLLVEYNCTESACESDVLELLNQCLKSKIIDTR